MRTLTDGEREILSEMRADAWGIERDRLDDGPELDGPELEELAAFEPTITRRHAGVCRFDARIESPAHEEPF